MRAGPWKIRAREGGGELYEPQVKQIYIIKKVKIILSLKIFLILLELELTLITNYNIILKDLSIIFFQFKRGPSKKPSQGGPPLVRGVCESDLHLSGLFETFPTVDLNRWCMHGC